MAQDILSIRRGSIRATVLIETITAAFQMDEIIFELREHSAGLNCGRWDCAFDFSPLRTTQADFGLCALADIFSFIKKMRFHKEFVLPDRGHIAMTVPFMDSYVRLLIKTCHRCVVCCHFSDSR